MPDNSIPSESRRYVFTGRVQGVGFRWTTNRIAKRFEVTGYVRNQSDGSVELVVTGTDRARSDFLAAIHDAFAANINDCAESKGPDGESFATFEIRR